MPNNEVLPIRFNRFDAFIGKPIIPVVKFLNKWTGIDNFQIADGLMWIYFIGLFFISSLNIISYISDIIMFLIAFTGLKSLSKPLHNALDNETLNAKAFKDVQVARTCLSGWFIIIDSYLLVKCFSASSATLTRNIIAVITSLTILYSTFALTTFVNRRKREKIKLPSFSLPKMPQLIPVKGF